jgi:hypothetical protein
MLYHRQPARGFGVGSDPMIVQRFVIKGAVKANDKGRWVRFSDHEKAIQELRYEIRRHRAVIEEAIAYVDADSSDGGETIAAWREVLNGKST